MSGFVLPNLNTAFISSSRFLLRVREMPYSVMLFLDNVDKAPCGARMQAILPNGLTALCYVNRFVNPQSFLLLWICDALSILTA